jgi:hypothetical protein
MGGIKLLEKASFMSDAMSDMVTTDKQDEKITLRLEPRLMELARVLIVQRKAGTISEYIRGLIIADAVRQGKSTARITIPGWLTDSFVELRLVSVHPDASPRSSDTSPTEEKEPRGSPNESSRDEGPNRSGKKGKR